MSLSDDEKADQLKKLAQSYRDLSDETGTNEEKSRLLEKAFEALIEAAKIAGGDIASLTKALEAQKATTVELSAETAKNTQIERDNAAAKKAQQQEGEALAKTPNGKILLWALSKRSLKAKRA